MSEPSGKESLQNPKFRLVDRDRVRIEFLIDDLLRQIKIDGISPIAACNGCNSCSANVSPEVIQ